MTGAQIQRMWDKIREGGTPPFNTFNTVSLPFKISGLSVVQHFFNTFNTYAFYSPFSTVNVETVAVS
jgi:hypothetical protein